jgi:CheY-like chemotaxis protein
MRFLVVDDSSTMRRIIINTLHELGHQDCQEAENGKEGLQRLDAGPVDVIITDWNMPEMSGIEFIKAVRSLAPVKHIPGADGDDQRREGRHRRGARGRRQQLRRQAVHARHDQSEDRGRAVAVGIRCQHH